jgi:DNA-directed RNA polymerase specialized sigma24 family protein
VAEQLGRSKGAVATLLFRGLTRLRKRLAEEERVSDGSRAVNDDRA